MSARAWQSRPVSQVRSEILRLLRGGAAAWDPATWRRVASRLHADQARRNPIYRGWVRANGGGKRPSAMPLAAWREARVFCGRGRAREVFESSGTTSTLRGRHYFRDLAVYEASVVAGWEWGVGEWMKPGAASLRRREHGRKFQYLALMPSPTEAPRSSLSRMLEILARRFEGGPCFWAMRRGKWDWDGLVRRLEKEGRGTDTTVVFGTAFGWVHFLDWCAARGRRFRLGRRVLAIETGGYKGRSREVSREELHRGMARTLGIPPGHIQVEYSMCEISSQAWSIGGLLYFPPWCRVRVMPPRAGEKLRRGEPGILEIHDLANTDSCAFVRSEDLAVADGEGFFLAGRVPRAGLKGCSLGHE